MKKRLFAIFGAILIIAAMVAAFAIPISAESTTSNFATVFYKPNVTEQGSFKIWSYASDTYYNYTGNLVVYMIYESDNPIGSWTLLFDEGNVRLNWSGFETTNGYSIASASIETDLEIYGEVALERVLVSPLLTSNTNIEFLVIGYEDDDQGIYYIAKSLCGMAQYSEDYESYFFLDVIRDSINISYDNGLDIGRDEGKEIAYDDIINEQKPIWEQKAFDRGVIKGRQDEYDYIVENIRPQWEDIAFRSGKQEGYSDGIKAANTFTPQIVPFAIMDAITTMFSGLLNFELFGINFLSVFGALITIAIAIFVFKKVL